jgi:ATP-dependent RNA helicase DDX56/DBP9
MKHVPKYLLPKIAPVSVPGTESVDMPAGVEKAVGFVPFKKHNVRGRGTRGRGRGSRSGASSNRKKSDPLKKFGR